MAYLELNEVMNALKENGYKATEQRKAIVEAIFSQNDYVSAKDILNQVQQQYPGLSFDTIYRNLSILLELDLVEEAQFEGEARFRRTCTQGHHHHLVCTRCGKVIMLPNCPMDLLQGIAGNFKITGHKFEIYGLCETCQ